MKKEYQEAFNLVSTVCAHFSANLETHNKIQRALAVIHGKLELDKTEMGLDVDKKNVKKAGD